MRKILLAIALAFLFPALAHGQCTIVTVTGTVTDPHSLPYSLGTISADLTPATAAPTCGNLPFTTHVQAGLDVTGSFSMNLPRNSTIVPSGTNWLFTINGNSGLPAPMGTGGQSFTVTVAIVGTGSPVTQSITANIQAVPPPALVNGLGGGGAGNPCTTTPNSVQYNAASTFGCITNLTSNGVNPFLTAIAAPATPGSGLEVVYEDSTNLRFHDENASGSIGTTVVANAGATHQWFSALSAAGALTSTQPAFTDISGTAAEAQLPATTVFTDQNATFGAHTYDFSGMTLGKWRLSAGLTTTVNGDFGFDTTNSNWHFWDGADLIMAPLAAGFVSGHCGQPTSSAGKWTINDTGSACGTSGGSGTVSNCSTVGGNAYYAATGTAVSCDATAMDNGAGGLTAVSYTTSGSNGGITGVEGTGANTTPAVGSDTQYADSTNHCWHETLNNVDVGCTTTASNTQTLTNKTIGLANLATQANATMVANTSGATASPTAVALPTSANLVNTNANGAPGAANQSNVNAVGYVAGGGTANAQTVTLSPAITALTTGLGICWLPAAANTTTTPSITVNGLSGSTIIRAGGAALSTSDLTTTSVACAIYNGSNFVLQNPQSSNTIQSCAVLNSIAYYFEVNNGTTIACNSLSQLSQTLYAAGTGTAQAQTVTLSAPLSAYAAGEFIEFLPLAANTAAAPTLNVNGLGAKNITKYGTQALVASDLSTTAIAQVVYDGTEFQLLNPQAEVLASSDVKVGSSPPACTAGTAGAICYGEGTAPTNVASTDTIYGDSTSHSLRAQVNGAASTGLVVLALPGSIDQTAQTAAITTATLCAASAGACNQTGQYHVHWNFWGSGTACTSVTAGSVTFLLTWTDENAVAHSAVALEMMSQTGAATTAMQATFPFQTALANESASGDMTISTNGSVIQYATGYTACTTGTGTYNLRAAVTRVQ